MASAAEGDGVAATNLRATPATRDNSTGEGEIDLRDGLDERGEPWLDLAYQLLRIGFALVAAFAFLGLLTTFAVTERKSS